MEKRENQRARVRARESQRKGVTGREDRITLVKANHRKRRGESICERKRTERERETLRG